MKLFTSIRVRASQGTQYIRDLDAARPEGFVGRPRIATGACASGCAQCKEACPTGAVSLTPVAIDLGRCVFCRACEEICPEHKIEFTADASMATSRRDALVVREGDEQALRVEANQTFARLFGRSLKLRQVSAGGCNACELELNAAANVNFDVGRFGIDWVASPRHADALVLSGPITKNMREAVRLVWDALPEPRFLVAVGACAISGGLYDGAAGVERHLLDGLPPALFVPGCPPHPLTFVRALLDFLAVRR